MVIVSLIPYTDLLTNYLWNTDDIAANRFKNVSVMIWSLSTGISPLLVLFVAKKFNPHWTSYIVTIYVNITTVLGFLFLELNINIKSDDVFRIISFFCSVVLLLVARLMAGWTKEMRFKDEIVDEILKNG